MNKEEDREVYVMNPNAGGFRNAKAWEEWYEPKEVLVQALAVCDFTANKGVRVKGWKNDVWFDDE